MKKFIIVKGADNIDKMQKCGFALINKQNNSEIKGMFLNCKELTVPTGIECIYSDILYG